MYVYELHVHVVHADTFSTVKTLPVADYVIHVCLHFNTNNSLNLLFFRGLYTQYLVPARSYM